ncbi:MAG: hypothetical protein HYZ28_24185 [Myxococcales bacterium]|nr:hypothetical protein [Myxococcales bacterium]
MGQVLLRALHLLRRPGVVLSVLAIAGGGSALAFAPLFGLPGYELSCALAVGVGLWGGGVGVAAAGLERRMIQGRDPRPARARRFENAARAALAATGAALVLNFLALLPPVATSVTYALTSSKCDPFAQVGFFPALSLPSAAIASAAGVLCGFAARRTLLAGLLYAGLVALSLTATFWPIAFGPQVFAYNHFAGYLPGPLYDEALSVSSALLWFRAQTLLLAVFAWLWAALFLDMREGLLRRPHLRPGSFLLLAAVGAAVLAIEERGPSLGFRTSHEEVAEKLGGRRETAHFTLHYPRGKIREEVERLERDLEFRHAQLSRFFGQAPQGKIRVFLYRSAQEKGALVGASRTQYAKPWLLELHLNDAPFPHGTLKHELAHVMAAPFGSGPFRITSRLYAWPNIGVVEGMAVAADDPVDELTLHEWSSGMRRQGLLPDIRGMLDPRGFYQAAPARAYTAAGSFLRHLADTYGPDKLRALYAHGDFATVYGRRLEDLATEWEAFLEKLPLDEPAVNLAFSRFRKGSLFSRPCAREVANLSAEAAELSSSDPERAAALFRRCAEVQPDEPSFALGEAAALSRAGKRDEAERVLSSLADRTREQPALSAEVAMAQADAAHDAGRNEEARAHLERLLSLGAAGGLERTARVKLSALAQGRLGALLWAYFRPGHDDVKLLLLQEADPKNPYAAYLIGRRISASAPEVAQGYLRTALSGELPDSLRREAQRLEVETAFLSGDCGAVRDAVGRLPEVGAAFKASARSWVERCDFEGASFNGPLVPEGPFR